MHESQAKAYFLRDIRQARKSIDAFYKLPHEFASKKHVLTFARAFREAHQGVVLFEYKKPSRHQWHYHSTYFYVEPTAFDEDGIGKLIMVQQTTLDSKKLIKNDLEELLKIELSTDIMFHSHFFIRLIQRANLTGLQPALALIADAVGEIMLYIKYAKQEVQTGKTIYIVFPDKVFVVTPETEQNVLVFKTVLLAEFMTDKQQQLYRMALAEARLSSQGYVIYRAPDDQQDHDI